MYYEDSLAWASFNADLRRPSAKSSLKSMDQFYADAAAGRLPAFSFIEPRIASAHNQTHTPSFGLANHQHPVASVLEGERLIKNVYEALRGGPLWNSTLFVLTYDEHGGFFDHVAPPQTGWSWALFDFLLSSPQGLDSLHIFPTTTHLLLP